MRLKERTRLIGLESLSLLDPTVVLLYMQHITYYRYAASSQQIGQTSSRMGDSGVGAGGRRLDGALRQISIW